MGLQPAALDQALQHALAVAEDTLRRRAHHLVEQNLREGAGQVSPNLRFSRDQDSRNHFSQIIAQETRHQLVVMAVFAGNLAEAPIQTASIPKRD
jgi:hypothetical protein